MVYERKYGLRERRVVYERGEWCVRGSMVCEREIGV